MNQRARPGILCCMMFERLEDRRLLTAVLAGGTLTVIGTKKSDSINIRDIGTNIVVTIVNQPEESFAISRVKHLVVQGGDGNDHIVVGFKSTVLAASIFGDAGNDTLEGTASADFLHGGAGDDSLVGNAGNDTLVGGSGDDTLRGGPHSDILNGADGTDLALTQGTDDVRHSESIDPANAFAPMELANLGLTIAVDVATTHPLVTLTFASVPNGAKFSVHWTRHIANRFLIVADVERNTENLAPKLAKKTATIDLGKQAPGTYTVEVWSATGKSKQTMDFTTTVAL
jgi:hypothetical protein